MWLISSVAAKISDKGPIIFVELFYATEMTLSVLCEITQMLPSGDQLFPIVP